MQTSIAQAVALTIYGNAYLRGQHTGRFFPDNSTTRFCRKIDFVELKKGWRGTRETVIAADPCKWFRSLKDGGAERIWLTYQPANQPGIEDRMAVAFVGGGGHWRIAVPRRGATESWEARWVYTGSRGARGDQRVWDVTYGLIDSAQDAGRDTPPSLESLAGELTRVLTAASAFAQEQSLDNFASCFERALEALTSDAPLSAGYHTDIAPPRFLPLAAERILAAIQAAWVFGGMGSWNDVSFEGAAQGRYDDISERLYFLLNRSATAAANTSSEPAA